MDHSNGLDDEISIDPPAPNIPMPRAVRALAGLGMPEWLARGRHRLTWRGWLLAAIAAVVVIGALKLAGVIWVNPPPKWVAALGPGVTVTGPEQVTAGHGSPGAALAGFLAALSSADTAAACGYAYADARSAAQCEAAFRRVQRNQLPYGKSVKIGYVAVDGTRALVGITGAICSPGSTPQCVTNADPAAIFSAGSTFTTLWAQRVNPSPSNNGYMPIPCSEVAGKWYVGPDPAASYS